MYKKIELKPKHKNARSVRSGISGNYGISSFCGVIQVLDFFFFPSGDFHVLWILKPRWLVTSHFII